MRFLMRLKILSRAPLPLSAKVLASQPYRHKPLRKLIDTAAFTVYGHWVQRTDGQNRGALFERASKPHPHTQSIAVASRQRLLSGNHDSEERSNIVVRVEPA